MRERLYDCKACEVDGSCDSVRDLYACMYGCVCVFIHVCVGVVCVWMGVCVCLCVSIHIISRPPRFSLKPLFLGKWSQMISFLAPALNQFSGVKTKTNLLMPPRPL